MCGEYGKSRLGFKADDIGKNEPASPVELEQSSLSGNLIQSQLGNFRTDLGEGSTVFQLE